MAKPMAIVRRLPLVVGVLAAIILGHWRGASAPTAGGANWIMLTAALLIGFLYLAYPRRGAFLCSAVALTLLAIWGIVGGPGPIGDASKPLPDNLLGFVYGFGLLMAPAAIIVIVRAAVSVLRWETGLASGRRSEQDTPARIRVSR